MANNLSDRVKQAMIAGNICHREEEFTKLLQRVRGKLMELVKANDDYSVIILTGSGTSAVESIIGSLPMWDTRLLVLSNGHYGDRIQSICGRYNIQYDKYVSDKTMKVSEIEKEIRQEGITHVAMVHHETSTRTLNPLRMIGKLCLKYNKKLIVDAVSSIGVHNLNVVADNIDFMAGSSNKGIGGPEGISYVVAKKDSMEDFSPRNYYLGLVENLDKQNEGQTLFTPAVRIFMGFDEALNELRDEGLDNRQKRFAEIAQTLRAGMSELGFKMLTECPSNVATLYDIGKYNFQELHKKLKSQNYIIYTGTNERNFRLCTYGDLNKKDIENFLEEFKKIIGE